ncbi:hypothetical protein D3C76_1627110 [compost metagenome]
MLIGQTAARANLRLQAAGHRDGDPGRHEGALSRQERQLLRNGRVEVEAGGQLRHFTRQLNIFISCQTVDLHFKRQVHLS